jgi:hypothetical protein
VTKLVAQIVDVSNVRKQSVKNIGALTLFDHEATHDHCGSFQAQASVDRPSQSQWVGLLVLSQAESEMKAQPCRDGVL